MKKKQDQISVKSFVALISAITALSIFATLFIISSAGITGAATGTVSGTVATNLNIVLTTSSINSGTVSVGSSDDTTDNTPAPFVVQNDGNVNADVTVQMTEALWDSSGAVPSDVQFKADVTTECGPLAGTACFAEGTSITTFTNMPTVSATLVIDCLNRPTATDSAEIDIRITVPSDESAGAKSGTIDVVATSDTGCTP